MLISIICSWLEAYVLKFYILLNSNEVGGFKLAKNLTKHEKEILRHEGFNPRDFLRFSRNAYDFVFVQVKTGKKLTIRV